MTSTIFLIIKIFLCIGAFLLSLFVLRKYRTSKLEITLLLLTLVFVLIAESAASCVPTLTDKITLTAMGENNPNAIGREIFIKDYIIEDEIVLPSDAVEGKWFWLKGHYMWRPEGDERQPKGTTRRIVMEVPVGEFRTINFDSNPWSGIVEVNDGTKVQTVDTYAENYVLLTESSSEKLMLNEARKLIAYILVLFAFSLLASLIIKQCLKDTEKTRVWWDSHWDKAVIFGISVIAVLYYFANSASTSFWLDEISQLYFIGCGHSVADTIKFSANLTEWMPPLFGIVANLWYRIMPYGEKWLLLLPILSCGVGIYATGLIGTELKNKRTGILASVFAATSLVVSSSCAFELRSYGFLFMFSSLLVLIYIRRLKSAREESWKSIIVYGIVMALCVYTHYMAVLLCLALFIIDTVLLIKKKISAKTVLSYFIGGALFLPWAIIFLCNANFAEKTWHPAVGLRHIDYLLLYYSSGNEWIYLLLVGAFALGAVELAAAFSKKNKSDNISLPAVAFSATILPIAIWFSYAFTHANMSLWMERYFMYLLPLLFVLMSLLADGICLLLSSKKAASVVCTFLCLFAVLTSFNAIKNHSSEPYREAANWLYCQDDIYSETTMVLYSGMEGTAGGWNEYYLQMKGRRDAVNITHFYDDDPSFVVEPRHIDVNSLLKYDKIYLYLYLPLTDDAAELLTDNYDCVEKVENLNLYVFQKKQ